MYEIMNDYSRSKIAKFMDGLKEKMPFQNEAQFQHALAMAIDKDIAENNKPYEVLLEVWTGSKTPGEEQADKRNCYTDIVILDASKKEYLAIELKYKTAEVTVSTDYGEIGLKGQGANDYGCYDYLWDVQRIGELISGENEEGNLKACRCVGGYAIFLTNEQKYWTNTRKDCKDRNGYYDFCIGNGEIKKTEPRKWHSPRDSQKEGVRKYAIKLGKCIQEDDFQWEWFCEIPEDECKKTEDAKKLPREFQYLCLTLKPN